MNNHFHLKLCALGMSAAMIMGCKQNAEEIQTEQPPAVVSVFTAQHQPIHLIENLPARVAAYRIAEIRPQVGGIVEKVLFKQGSDVKVGQPLFKINSDILQADVESNQATLQSAQAEVMRLKSLLGRYEQLLSSHAISQQEYNNTETAYRQAIADVAQLKAALTRQKLNLKYSTVTAPISGRIGQILVTEGALVGQADTKAMAVIQQISQVYVDVKQSISEYEKLQEALQQGTVSDVQPQVVILNSQGKPYQAKGQLLFSDTNVDPDTGDVTIRILVNNNQHELLPGMYVRVNINRAVIDNAILIPEQAIQHDMSGKTNVTVINPQGQAVVKLVKLGQRYQSNYVVTNGLSAGEKVVVEGADRIQPEQELKIKIWQPSVATSEKGAH
ncbi:efflux RND transporter periplasmic adaptor subunit [Acinetobacter gerneri]|jgi:multidrug efflux system membrane fusion protein|uniref:efflux RND transporter periplasmic adaptor subunit n=1 Tax=Acinetobacter gerneri TaxID=202952 RepID=UPI0023EF60B3|nr:efflux RND transporter periplasmic adaptor subunit [Acinetobacter gerneri]MCH4245059.1 efflux RND transporter periplasmic adaptor subunit [Acinetobacter gerneri]